MANLTSLLYPISAAVTTLPPISAAVTTLPPISAAVTTLPPISAAVTTLPPISAAVTSLPGNLVNTVNNIYNTVSSIYGSVYWQQWNAFSQTTTPALTSIILRTDQTFIASINGVSFAPYDQYLQIWNDGGPYSHNTVLISTQIIKSNENFNFEFVKGLACNGAWIVTSTTPLAYTQGNNDVFATVIYISI